MTSFVNWEIITIEQLAQIIGAQLEKHNIDVT